MKEWGDAVISSLSGQCAEGVVTNARWQGTYFNKTEAFRLRYHKRVGSIGSHCKYSIIMFLESITQSGGCGKWVEKILNTA